MPAPMDNKLPSKETFNLLARANICFSVILVCMIYFPLNTETRLDLIHSCLSATKTLIAVVVLYNASVSYFLFRYGTQQTSTQKTNVKVKNILKSLCILIVAIVFFHITVVLYGAPLFEFVTETFHFSMLLAATTILPGLFFLGINLSSWIRVFFQKGFEIGVESIVFITTLCSVTGAWLGAFPIPLDWDRPWQVWPISCVLGNLIGYSAGLVIGTIHMCMKYYKIRKLKIT